MLAIWEVDYGNISPWWIVLIVIVGIAIVIAVLSLATVGYDHRIYRNAEEAHRRSVDASLRQEEEYLRAREEAHRRAQESLAHDPHAQTAAS